MKRISVVIVALMTVAGATAVAHGPKPPKPDKKTMELAGKCVLAGMSAGAFTTLDAEALGTYCVDAAKFVREADYTVEEEE